jgi:pyruvate/2-oxoglutarate dehydrogenase complex dihydrolipoamide acyltransferase (E2) component
MAEGELIEWYVADGTAVEIGMPIYSLGTDKVENDIEAPAAGTLRHIGQAGETYPVGELIGTIE